MNNNHGHNFAMFLLLLSLLFIPIGFVGMGQVVGDSADVLSEQSIRVETIRLDQLNDDMIEEEDLVEETTDTPRLTPDLVIPFYR
ncbi:hypothetical protein HN803_06070 [candidate division WWE3 bacterium]|jgi:hypothetical protein|nr:hypothetical protein [candidate division WWE3 bacterium]MBT7350321.1 hypothetical protein [candidate division WWE3 bacterium]